MRISTKISLGFALVIILSAFDSFVNYQLSKQVNTNTEFLTNSEAIIRNSTRIHRSIIDMQSGFRGYLLTGQLSFLEGYDSGLKELPPLYNETRELIEGSPDQLLKLDSIALIHNQWIGYADALINARKDTSGLGQVRYTNLFEGKLKKEIGRKLNEDIKIKFKAFDRLEYDRRQDRRDMLAQSIKRTHTISFILGTLTLTVAIISAAYLTRIISRRINSMVKLADRIAKGNFKTLIDDTENDELSHLSESLNVMSVTLDKNFTELDQFAYVAAHDLKAPLRGLDNILNWIDEDMENQLSPELKKYHELMRGRIVRLENLINGLLEYARIGRTKKNNITINIRQFVSEIIEMIVPKSFHVTNNCPDITFSTDKLHLEQVFVNLVSNAVKYHDRADGTITISCRELENVFEFEVSDDGPGIPAEYHKKVFQIFQTLKEKDAFESTGVGLAIVKKIIDEHKTEIKLISEPGQGATFIFTWPKEKPENKNIII